MAFEISEALENLMYDIKKTAAGYPRHQPFLLPAFLFWGLKKKSGAADPVICSTASGLIRLVAKLILHRKTNNSRL